MGSGKFAPLPSLGSVWSWLVCNSQIFLLVLLEDMCHTCFTSVFRSLPQQQWPFSDNWDTSQLPHEYIPSVPMDLCTSSFFKHPLTWHFFAEGEPSLLQTFSSGSGTWDCWRLLLPGESELKSSVSTLALSVSFVSGPTASFSSRHTFYLLMHLQKAFLLPFPFLA